MDTARLFQSGRSQAVRLPKAYRFSGTEVIVKHFGNGVLLLPIEDPWQTLEAGLAGEQPVQHLHPHRQRQAAGCSAALPGLPHGGDRPLQRGGR